MRISLLLFMLIFIVGCSNFSIFNKQKIMVSTAPTPTHLPKVITVHRSSPYELEEPQVEISQDSSPKEQEGAKRVLNINRRENRELKKIMRSFDYLIFQKINMDMLQGEEDMFFGKNIYPLLKDFIKNSKKISTLYPQADDKYKKLAKSLYKKAKVLDYIIRKRKTRYFKLQLNSIIDTCNQCHSLYN